MWKEKREEARRGRVLVTRISFQGVPKQTERLVREKGPYHGGEAFPTHWCGFYNNSKLQRSNRQLQGDTRQIRREQGEGRTEPSHRTPRLVSNSRHPGQHSRQAQEPE